MWPCFKDAHGTCTPIPHRKHTCKPKGGAKLGHKAQFKKSSQIYLVKCLTCRTHEAEVDVLLQSGDHRC